MLWDPGAARVAGPARLCAAALAALLWLAGSAVAQDDLNNEAPIVAQPQPEGAAPPVKKHHRKKKPPVEAAQPAPMPTPTAADVVPPPPIAPAPVVAPVPEHTPPAGTAAQELDSEPWSAAVLLERLCADNLRHNEEDRLYGLISFTVRSTLAYAKSKFTAADIDDIVQDALDALIKACPRIVATDRAHRLGVVIDAIQDLATRRMAERRQPGRGDATGMAGEGPPESAEDRRIQRRAGAPLGKPSAADLSQELTSAEIDAWLDALPPLERALALFQFASDVTPKDIADALGIAPPALRKDVAATKTSLLGFFREQEDGSAGGGAPAPPIQYREAGASVATLLAADTAPPGTAPAPPGPPGPTLRVTGISIDLYAGWSLLALATGLPPDKGLDIVAPIVLTTGGDHPRRVIVVAAAEITRPDAPIRRYLLRAYAIDGDGAGIGFHDLLHLAPGGIDNAEAERTLRTQGLANIEIARCLWHDYGTGPDPGLCR
ncbi:MAG TPA: hypothetical protein VHW66_10435 [Stellaceae bacterium]|jgi:DNA-directed RNA polymerase specialized sigma24 family protein|nr:hypothetical protein [Stellaceae bacterium]